MVGRFLYFLQESLCALGAVRDREGFFEDITQCIAKQGGVVSLGVIERRAQDLPAVAGLLEELLKLWILL